MKKKNELAVITKDQFIKKYEPSNFLLHNTEVKTLEKALAVDNNSISVYKKELGTDTVLALIELHLVGLNASVNVNQNLTVNQIKEIAIEILSNFYFLNPAEIFLVFRKAKKGDYGKLYGALNMVDILNWFTIYQEERIKYFINKNTSDRFTDFSERSSERKEKELHASKLKTYKNNIVNNK